MPSASADSAIATPELAATAPPAPPDPWRGEPERDPGFEALLEVAVALFDCPCAMLWGTEDGRMRLLAARGLPADAAPSRSRLGTLAGPGEPVVAIEDASLDPRLADDALVGGPPRLRHLAATVLLGPAGDVLGMLAVGDPRPRSCDMPRLRTRIDALAAVATRMFGGSMLARCRHLADTGFSAVIMVDERGRTIFTNAAARELLGPVAIAGQVLDKLVPASLQLDPEGVSRWLQAAPGTRAGGSRSLRELRVRDAFGELRTVQAARCDWHDGNARGVMLVLCEGGDGGPRREPRSGRLDALTGLPNREALFATVDSLRGRGTRLGVALLGLDNFRAVNEALGHVIGDTVLQVVASRLMAWLPVDAHLARFGSDEFAILFPAPPDADSLEPRLQALLREIARPCEVEHQRVHVEASIGVAFDETGGANLAAYDDCGSSGLLALAALALRHAKRAGAMQLRRFSPAMREEAIDRRQLDLELRRAFHDGEFELHYQPQMDLASGLPSGAEALLRWRHPERGLLMPGAFIEALGRSAIAPQVGTWILQQACRDAASWPLVQGHGLKVGVNLFPAQFNDEALVEKIDQALAASGLPPAQLEIELTETIALRDDGVAERTLAQLRRRGIRVSYDDFGTGHASLSMLHRLPVDRVKIDRSFVRDLVASRGDKAIVRSITLIARNFDMEVIAEGVEHPDQALLLREFGCHQVQGFLYSQALAQRVFEQWVRARLPSIEAASAPAAEPQHA